MNWTEEQFFALLIGGLSGEKTDAKLFENGADWPTLKKMAEMQSIIGIVFDGIQSLPKHLHPPIQILVEWFGNVANIENLNKRHNTTLVSLINYLNSQGIGSRLLKGQGCASYYINPNHRQCGDIDLFVGIEQYTCAKSAIVTMNIKIDDESTKDAHFMWNDTPIELHRIEGELYWSKSNDKFQQICRKEEWLKPGIILIENQKIAIMNPTFNVFFVFVHLWHHFIQVGVGLRQICDWMQILRAEEEHVNWDKLHEYLKDLGLIDSWNSFYELTERFLGQKLVNKPIWMTNVADKDVAFLIEDIMQMGNFGKYGASMQKRNFGKGFLGNVYSYIPLIMRLKKIARFGHKEVIGYLLYKLIHGVKS